VDFTVADGDVVFGMGAIKNVGTNAVKAMVEEREANGPYDDIYDFCARLDGRVVNRRLIENLVKAGAFMSTGWNRRQTMESLDSALQEGQSAQRDRDAGQTSLFDMAGMEETVEELHKKPDVPDWPEYEILQYEKEVLGLYASSHPLDEYRDLIHRFTTLNLQALRDCQEGEEVLFGGILSQAKPHMTKSGNKMAFLTVETLQGSCELTVFSDLFQLKAGLLSPDTILMFKAHVNFRNGEAGLVADDVYPIEETEAKLARAVHVRVPAGAPQETLDAIALALGEARGSGDVYLHVPHTHGGEVIIHATDACRVAPTRALRMAIESLLGEDSVYFSAGENLPSHTPKRIERREPKFKRAAGA